MGSGWVHLTAASGIFALQRESLHGCHGCSDAVLGEPDVEPAPSFLSTHLAALWRAAAEGARRMTPKLLVQPRYFSRDDRAVGGLIILTAEEGIRGKGSPRNRRVPSWTGPGCNVSNAAATSDRTPSSRAASAPTGKDAPPRRASRRCHCPRALNRPLLCRGSRSAFAGGPTWRPAVRAFMDCAEILAYQRCHRIGTTNAFATSVVKNPTSGTSTAVLRAATRRIVDTSCIHGTRSRAQVGASPA